MLNLRQAVDAKAEVYLGARTSGTGSPVDIDPGASGTGILFKLEGINLTVGVRQRPLVLRVACLSLLKLTCEMVVRNIRITVRSCLVTVLQA